MEGVWGKGPMRMRLYFKFLFVGFKRIANVNKKAIRVSMQPQLYSIRSFVSYPKLHIVNLNNKTFCFCGFR